MLFERLDAIGVINNSDVSVAAFLEETLPPHLLLESVRPDADLFKVSPEKIVTMSAIYETITDEQLDYHFFDILGSECDALAIAIDHDSMPPQALQHVFSTNTVVREDALCSNVVNVSSRSLLEQNVAS